MKLTMKAARVNAGKKQSEVASAVGLNHAVYSMLERHIVYPTDDLKKKIAKACGIPEEDIDFYA